MTLLGLTWADWLGVFGSFTICAAYLSVSIGWVAAQRRAYHVANLAGSLALLVSLYYRPNVGAIVIEVLWACIALFSLWRIARQ